MASEEGIPEDNWQKMAVPLQIQFAHKVQNALGHYEKRLIESEELLEKIRKDNQKLIQNISKDEGWKKWRVIAVDGSSSTIAEKNGLKIACISAIGIEIDVSQNKTIDEFYVSDVIVDESGRDDIDDYIALKRFELERKIVRKACEKKPDLIIIDGPFIPNNKVIEASEDGNEFKNIQEDTLCCFEQMVPIIGVVKRSHTKYFYSLNKLNHTPFPDITDKVFLSILLNKRSFTYLDTISNIRKTNYRVSTNSIRPEKTAEDFLNRYWKVFDKKFKDVFDAPTYFIKAYSDSDAIKVEIPEYCNKELRDQLLSFLVDWANEDTGLPYALDLADAISLVPSEFSDDFVAELEAGLYTKLRDPSKIRFISRFFGPLNPQAIYKSGN